MQTLKHLAGYLLPVVVILASLGWFSEWQINGRELLRASGISALTLFGIIFIIGPLPRFWNDLSPWKVFRPYWAKWAVLLAFIHMLLGYAVAYDFDLAYMLNSSNPRILAVVAGLASFLYFFFMMVISEKSIRAKLGMHWKQLHTGGYAAFMLALLHFWLNEQRSGQLSFDRLAERLLFTFAIIVLVLRGYVFIWVHFTNKQTPPEATSSEPR